MMTCYYHSFFLLSFWRMGHHYEATPPDVRRGRRVTGEYGAGRIPLFSLQLLCCYSCSWTQTNHMWFCQLYVLLIVISCFLCIYLSSLVFTLLLFFNQKKKLLLFHIYSHTLFWVIVVNLEQICNIILEKIIILSLKSIMFCHINS